LIQQCTLLAKVQAAHGGQSGDPTPEFVEQVLENQEVLATIAVDDDQDEEDVLQTHNRSSKSFSSAFLSLYPFVFIFSFCLCSQVINLKL
jgi:hypothetical protein